MRNKQTFIFLLFMASILSSCGWDTWLDDPIFQEEYEPIYLSRDELNKSVYSDLPQEMVNPGKIYVLGQYLFINEKYKGIHVIDNRNPDQPKPLGFIHIPGNIDMAGKGIYIYVDNAVDMVTLNISNPASVQIVDRQENTFPTLEAPDGRSSYDSSQGIVVGWQKK